MKCKKHTCDNNDTDWCWECDMLNNPGLYKNNKYVLDMNSNEPLSLDTFCRNLGYQPIMYDFINTTINDSICGGSYIIKISHSGDDFYDINTMDIIDSKNKQNNLFKFKLTMCSKKDVITEIVFN